MVVRLDPTAAVPLYEQLRAQVSVMVAVGQLEPGCRLPTVRYLAATLGLAPGTVARAYGELERDGTLVGQGRRGTFVSAEPPHSEPLRQRRERLAAAADRFAFELRQLGVGADESHRLLDEALTRTAADEAGIGAPTS
ncbi:MAG TPA: GntR family transcriptional regulator [Acidimicrobiaceae bacterium]|nr:GntR family transcriptional regulator [Acidimicrobiaceae bacterium]